MLLLARYLHDGLEWRRFARNRMQSASQLMHDDLSTDLLRYLTHLLMVREQDDLHSAGDTCQDAYARGGALIVELDKDVIHDER